jgi:hypothetical protein
MKNYNNFILEAVDSQIFIKDYDILAENLEKFWSLLEDKKGDYDEINSRNRQDVINFNENIRKNRTPPPPVIKIGDTFSFTSNSGNTFDVRVISIPNQNGKVSVERIVKVNNISDQPFSIDISKLKPLKVTSNP